MKAGKGKLGEKKRSVCNGGPKSKKSEKGERSKQSEHWK